jgi:hypothetical protein
MTDQQTTWPMAVRTPEVVGRVLASSRASSDHIQRLAAWAMEFNRDAAADAGATIRAYFGNPGRLATHVHCLLLPALAATDALPTDANEDALEAVVTRTYDAWATAAAPQLAEKFSKIKNRTSP